MTCLEQDQASNQVNFIYESNKINEVLSILLPKFIRNRLSETDEYNILQNQGNVAIVFCDICEFDSIIMVEQENIVQFLDILFRQFDKFCQKCGLQKIETVGKTYMASAGLQACEQDLNYLSSIEPVQRALNLALLMMNFISNTTWGTQQKQKLIGKIGIHYGRAISGVIGHHKPQFSLIGDTVNTTSRVCSTGLDGKITLSEQAHQQLKNTKTGFIVREVEMKGLGLKPTYVVDNSIRNKTVKQTLLKPEGQKLIRQSSFQVKKQRGSVQDIDLRGGQTSNKTVYELQLIAQQGHKTRQFINNQVSIVELRQDSRNSLSYGNVDKQIPSTPLANSIQSGFKDSNLKPYNPEIRSEVDYQFLLNVLMLKNEQDPTFKYLSTYSFYQTLKNSFQNKNATNQLNMVNYQSQVQEQSTSLNSITISLFCFIFGIKQFCFIPYYNDLEIPFIVMQWIQMVMILCQLILDFLNVKNRILITQLSLLIIALLMPIMYILHDLQVIIEIQYLEQLFLVSVFCSIQVFNFWSKVAFALFVFIYQSMFLLIFDDKYWLIYYFFACSLYNTTFVYYLEEQQIASFNQNIVCEQQHQKQLQLVKYLLPKHVLASYLENNYNQATSADNIQELTILFADIAGFTEYSSQVSPEQVLNMLKNLFVDFDKKCQELNVYKLYTIGDCYVAIGMQDLHNRLPGAEARNVVELGFQMIDIISEVRQRIQFEGLQMRIGIHTGKVIGGVMGTDIVRYDIYGPDVLIANKMESNGKKGFVQVSETTKAMLENVYSGEYTYDFNTTLNLAAIDRIVDGYIISKTNMDVIPEIAAQDNK